MKPFKTRQLPKIYAALAPDRLSTMNIKRYLVCLIGGYAVGYRMTSMHAIIGLKDGGIFYDHTICLQKFTVLSGIHIYTRTIMFAT